MYKTSENKLLVQNIVFWLCFASSSFLYISPSFIHNGAKAYIIYEVALKFLCFAKTFANSIRGWRQKIYKKFEITKGQIISKYLFGVFSFFQKTNENKWTWGIIVVKSNSFVRFLEEIDDSKTISKSTDL